MCRENKIPVHLDGARIYLVSAWSGVPIKEYAALADTVYISLYKYLGASSGAVLCGKEVIDQMPHLLIKNAWRFHVSQLDKRRDGIA